MFGALTYEVIADPRLSHADLRVLMALSAYANRETGCAFPSVRRLERETPLSRRAIQAALAKCVRIGLLSVTHRSDDRGTTSSEYRFLFDRFGSQNAGGRNQNAGGRTQDAHPAQPERPPGATVAPKQTKDQTKDQKTPPVAPQAGTVADAPKTSNRDWQQQPWAPIVHAYREHLPHRPQPRDSTINGKLGKSIAKRWKEQPDADWWARLLKCCAADEWYSGRGQWAGVSLAWLSTPTGLQKASDKFHAQMTGAKPQGPAAAPAVLAWNVTLDEWLAHEGVADLTGTDAWRREAAAKQWHIMNGSKA